MLKLKRCVFRALATLLMCHPPLLPVAAQQKGKATYYSRKAHGARTSSGIRLNNDSLYCAHRTHPYGTLLRVRNLKNGKEVIVKVIDRGPFTKGRIIDLTTAAAKALDMISAGVVPVEVTVYDEKDARRNAATNTNIIEKDTTRAIYKGTTTSTQKSAAKSTSTSEKK